MTQHTSRLGLRKPSSDNSESPAGPAQIGALADDIDIAAIYGQGILSSRPVSSSGSPGITGRFYYVKGDSTTANNGILWLDHGTGWVQANAAGTIADLLANRPAGNTVPAGTTFFATDQVADYVSDGTGWLRKGQPAGATSLCLGAAADAGYILLTGQAWPSTTGIYADLHTKLGGTTLPDFRGVGPVGFKTADADFGTLLATGGEKKHTLTQGELPSYTIPFPNGGKLVNTPGTGAPGGSGGGFFPTGDTGIQSGGSGLSHNNLQPFIVVNYQAKL